MALKRKDVRALFEDADTSTEEKVAKLMKLQRLKPTRRS